MAIDGLHNGSSIEVDEAMVDTRQDMPWASARAAESPNGSTLAAEASAGNAIKSGWVAFDSSADERRDDVGE